MLKLATNKLKLDKSVQQKEGELLEEQEGEVENIGIEGGEYDGIQEGGEDVIAKIGEAGVLEMMRSEWLGSKS
jgi:hypothetical protein